MPIEAIAYPVIEAELIAFYNAASSALGWGCEAFESPPRARPKVFITVQRVGGETTGVFTDVPLVAVQVWATTMAAAAQLARLVRAQTYRLPEQVPDIARVDIQALTQFPDPDAEVPRYQFAVQLTTTGRAV
ncbi:hypothetical protein [Gryllotalpicola protaetiae]|uniref:DUF3168 domain-containing protein n=1 Tax=Gryllotalpicola protaetiae TaxID=2419771 RepID=A0A387BMD9_9MICO|nr:hypothetical protein [Gryllotalpicola protaetiae]AYG02369.1 hypothetical protein D7I44_01690 [Gryllotalpicola protaetiae]